MSEGWPGSHYGVDILLHGDMYGIPVGSPNLISALHVQYPWGNERLNWLTLNLSKTSFLYYYLKKRYNYSLYIISLLKYFIYLFFILFSTNQDNSMDCQYHAKYFIFSLSVLISRFKLFRAKAVLLSFSLGYT